MSADNIKFLKAIQAEGRTVISVTGEIGFDFRADDLIRYLQYYASEKILLNIFSFGGNAFHALAIYDYITANGHDVEANIYGMCGSAATVISCAAKTAGIGENSFFFVHNAYNTGTGEQDEIARQVSERMIEIYAKKTKMDRRNIRKLMAAGDEANTMMSAKQALEYGFVDKILKEKASVAASIASIFDHPSTNQDKAGQVDGTTPPAAAEGISNHINTDTMKTIFTGLVKALFGDSAKHIETDAQAQEFLEKTGKPVEELVKTATAPAASTVASADLDKIRQESADAIKAMREAVDAQIAGVVEQVKQLAETITAKFQEKATAEAEKAKEESKVNQSLAGLTAAIDALKGIRSGHVPTTEAAAQVQVPHNQQPAPTGQVVKSAGADEWWKNTMNGANKKN